MLHGDITNSYGYSVGVRCEDTLFHLERFGAFRENLIYKLGGKSLEENLDTKVQSILNRVYKDTPMTVSIVVDNEHFTKALVSFLDKKNICYANIINVSSLSEVHSMLNTGAMTYFVSERGTDTELINERFGYTPDKFFALLQRDRLFRR